MVMTVVSLVPELLQESDDPRVVRAVQADTEPPAVVPDQPSARIIKLPGELTSDEEPNDYAPAELEQVDGVYDSDPKTHPDAVKFERLSYMETVSRRLSVMDTTAVTLCMENDIPILVLNLWEPEALIRGIMGEPIGTLVSSD